MATTAELLAKRAELEAEIRTASQYFDSWKVIKLCREQIASIDEVLKSVSVPEQCQPDR